MGCLGAAFGLSGSGNRADICSLVGVAMATPYECLSLVCERGERRLSPYTILKNQTVNRYTVSLWYFSPALVMGWGHSGWWMESG